MVYSTSKKSQNTAEMVSSPSMECNSAKITQMPKGFLTSIEVEPVGRWFLSHWERLHSARGLSTSGKVDTWENIACSH